jgi:hypothetical protein
MLLVGDRASDAARDLPETVPAWRSAMCYLDLNKAMFVIARIILSESRTV